jgi:hypothetical protein
MRKYSTKKWRNFVKTIRNLFFCFFVFNSCYSQTIKVKNAIGYANVSGDISPNKARVDALNAAKITALQNAGISENINSYQTLYSNQVNNDFKQIFSSQIQSQLEGNIKSYIIKKERIYCKNEFEIVYEVTIDAEVIKYKSEIDNKYQVNVTGIKGTYTVDDYFNFNLRSTADSYLTIFDLLDTTAYLVYPQTNNSAFVLNKNKDLKFPFEGEMQANVSNDKNEDEIHRLLLVFTKDYYPYILHDDKYISSSENVINWLNSIEPYKKNFQYYSFIISPK